MNAKLTAVNLAVMAVLASGSAQAMLTPMVTTSGNNFTMINATGGLQGGANDVVFNWDGTLNNAVAGSYMNATLTQSAPTPFFSNLWTAHDVRLFGAGTYTFYTGCIAGSPGCGLGASYTLTVQAGQVGAHMLFDWNNNFNIDVVQLYTFSPIGSANQSTNTALNNWRNSAGTVTGTQINPFCNGTPGVNPNTTNSCFATTPTTGMNTRETVWDAVSIDTGIDADNWNGTKFIDGPFASPASSANFNLNGLQATALQAVPVPAAAWLLGSGLLGLVGVARRKS